MSVWNIGLCFMLSTCCCVSANSWGQEGPGGPGGPGGGGGAGGGGSGGGGPVEGEADICYVEEKFDCAGLAAHFTAFELQPLKVGCGHCYRDVNQNWTCPNAPGTAIFPIPSDPDPNGEKPIAYAKAAPLISGGNLTGKKEITLLPEENCGAVRSCTGCPPIVIPGVQPFCTVADDVVSPWMITPRQLAGEECQSSKGTAP